MRKLTPMGRSPLMAEAARTSHSYSTDGDYTTTAKIGQPLLVSCPGTGAALPLRRACVTQVAAQRCYPCACRTPS